MNFALSVILGGLTTWWLIRFRGVRPWRALLAPAAGYVALQFALYLVATWRAIP
jgi:hypothetical protein